MLRAAGYLAFVCTTLSLGSACGQTLTTLHVFTGPDGAIPDAPLLYEKGFFYGTTTNGGEYGHGTVFKFDPRTGIYSVLASFVGGTHGIGPTDQFVYLNGSIFVTTYVRNHGGSVFKIDHDTGASVRLRLFQDTQPLDQGLAQANGALYGATSDTLYSLNVRDRAYDTLFTFTDPGMNPRGAMTLHNGILYGVTSPSGSVFSLDTATGNVKTIATFTDQADGANPNGGLVYRYGRLFGTTYLGGDESGNCQGSCGVVYSVDPATGAENVLHRFTGKPDGANPTSSLIYTFGMIYGTTEFGGAYSQGTVFQVDPASGAETVLYSFKGGDDGQYPLAGLALWNGALYGTTAGGQGGAIGTLFKIVP